MPDHSIIAGTLQPLRQRFTRKFSPSNGLVESTEWMGFGEAEMVALSQQVADSGGEYDFTNALGVYTLTATDTSGAVTIDSWEIGAQDEIVASTKNPLNIANCATGELDVIARAIRNGSTIAEAAIAMRADDSGGTYPSTLGAYAARLYQRLLTDSTGFFDSKYVLRHTTNVSNRWGLNIADINVNCIYSTAELISEVQDPTLWIAPLPGRLAFKINAITSSFISRYGTIADFQVGWLKSASSENTAANNRVNIVTDYKFYRWSTDEYAQA